MSACHASCCGICQFLSFVVVQHNSNRLALLLKKMNPLAHCPVNCRYRVSQKLNFTFETFKITTHKVHTERSKKTDRSDWRILILRLIWAVIPKPEADHIAYESLSQPLNENVRTKP